MDSLERNVSYGLMMVLFGPVYVVTAIIVTILAANTGCLTCFLVAQPIGSPVPTYVLFAAGLLGVITGMKRVSGGRLAKPYDVIFGIVFSLAGLILIIGDIFKVSALTSAGASAYALIYAFFGLTALYRGVQRMPASS